MLRLCRHQVDTAGAVVDSLERFPNVYCPTCKKTQSWFFYVAKGNAYLDHGCVDIVCSACKNAPPKFAFRSDRSGSRPEAIRPLLAFAPNSIASWNFSARSLSGRYHVGR